MSYIYTYPRPSLTVDCIILRQIEKGFQILLIQRDRYPFEGLWALPGGFIEMDELLADAAKRELSEETGLSGINLEQFRTFDKIDRDPRGRTISVVFFGFLDDLSIKISAASDARDAQWFSMKNLPVLAFDHNEIIDLFIKEKINR